MRTNKIPHRRTSRSGLTLLELVMVVSILAILTALVVPGMGDQQEETRRTVARATMQDLRDVIANRYMQDMSHTVLTATTGAVALPQPNRLVPDSLRVTSTSVQADGSTAGVIPQLHFLFVNPNQYDAGSTPQYMAVNDYDSQSKIGWNGPYVMTKTTTYPDPDEPRFPKDPNATQDWSGYGFTTQFGEFGDFTVMDPWGSPYVIIIRNQLHGGSTAYTANLVSGGPNRRLETTDVGTAPTGDDLLLPIKTWK